MDDIIDVGVLGMGTIGVTHARALNDLRASGRLVAFSGGDPSVVAEAGWPDAQQMSPQRLLEDSRIQAIAICSPSGLHAEHALRSLEAGRHVVVEKPLALTVADARRIVTLAEEKRLTLSVMSQRRFEPEVVAVREALEAGLLGPLRLVTTQMHWWRGEDYYRAARWRSDPALGGGSVFNQGVHNIDLLQWLAGPVESVTAQSATLAHDGGAEDTTVATLGLASGGLGLVSTSTATPPGSPATLTLYCERGFVEIGQGEILRWEVGSVPVPQVAKDGDGIGAGAADPAAIGIAGHVQQWSDIIAALQERRPPRIDGRDGAATVRLLAAITTAARTGRLTTLEEL